MPAVLSWPWVVSVSAAGFLLTLWAASRLTTDRWCVRIVLWAYTFKVLLTVALYVVSYYHLPVLQQYQGERGFWIFADDALAYHNHAHNLNVAWNGQGAYPETGISNWSFIIYVAGFYRVLGDQPLVVSLLNAWYGTIIIGAGLVIMQRWALPRQTLRLGTALLGFWPSLLVWSVLPLKDPLLLAWTLVGLCALLELIRAWNGPGREFLALTGVWGLANFVLVLFRDYMAIQLATVGSVILAGLAARGVAAKAYGSAVRLLAVAVLVPVMLKAVGQPDLRKMVVPPTPPVAESATEVVVSADVPAELEMGAAVPSVAAVVPDPEPVASVAAIVPEPEPVLAIGVSPSPPAPVPAKPPTIRTRLRGWVNAIPRMLDNRRKGFVSTGGHSLMDPEVRFPTAWHVVQYLPKSLSLALLAPFPWQWFDTEGQTRGLRTWTALEALLMYVLLAGLLFRMPKMRSHLNIDMLTLLLFILVSAVPLSLVVANLGTLFRLRLQYVLPLIILLCGLDVWGRFRDVFQRVSKPWGRAAGLLFPTRAEGSS